MTALATPATGPQAKRGRSPVLPARDPSIDRVRGVAVVCMILDHLCLILGGPYALLGRLTAGRLAMPLFFVTAGHVTSGRIRGRHALVAVAGLLLPLVVPWVDAPNVLLWWAAGCVLLAACKWAGWSPAILVFVGLGLAANDWATSPGTSYPPVTLFALMGLGALLPASWWAWGERMPAWTGWVGRHALGIYLWHTIGLTALAVYL